MHKVFIIGAIFLAINIFADETAYNDMPNQEKQYPSKSKPLKCNQGHARDENSMISAYNMPARYDVCGNYDFYIKGSFIYWQILQEGMSFAFTTTNDPDPNDLPYLGTSFSYIDFKFKPGFKVGVGLNSTYDNWDVYLEYTWMNLTDSKKVFEPNGGRLFYYLWWDTVSNTQTASQATTTKATWKLKLNILDFELGRFYYVGSKLTFRPFIGPRTAWINQNMTIKADVVNYGEKQTKYVSDSWSLGARAGLYTNWLLSKGFRSFGNVAASLLFTDYHKITRDEDAIDSSTVGNVAIQEKDKYKFLRTNLEFILGFGWGRYFSNNTSHFDLVLGYDFVVFFHQNMMRYISDVFNIHSQASPGNLYAHGLRISMQFDF
jgi:hypothetical protein